MSFEDAFTAALGKRRGARPNREYRLIGRQSWRAVLVDAGTELDTMTPSEDSVALYECSAIEAGHFVALLATRAVLEATASPRGIAVGDGEGRWILTPDVLTQLKSILGADRRGARCQT
jgi:hypothetical protein